MGLFDILDGIADAFSDGQSSGSSRTNHTSNNSTSENSLGQRREDAINLAKQWLYDRCFSIIVEMVPDRYESNRKDFAWSFNAPDQVRLDMDTMHKVLLRATYDALKEIGIENYSKPQLTPGNDSGTVYLHIRWE